jgi:ubiquinone/menaquinone biosynthesis C-methylase UbiE
MVEKKSMLEIRQYWDNASELETDGQGLRPVARDPYLQEAVESAVEGFLAHGESVLDIGCGDGLSTLKFARHVNFITGVDYVDRFVERANKAAKISNIQNVEFITGDVLNLEVVRKKVGFVDMAISIRCLINQNTWDRQKQAISEIAKCIKPGGRYILSEGWLEGMNGLNSLRRRSSLAEITTVDYNLLISRKEFESFVSQYFVVEKYVGLGFYLVMSRFLQPFVEYPNPPQHNHRINKLASSLQKYCTQDNLFDEFDYAGIYVLRRKA